MSASGEALAQGDDPRVYRALDQALTADLEPSNAIEAGYTRSIIHHTWTIQRWRMIEAFLMVDPTPNETNRESGVAKIESPTVLGDRDNRLLGLIRARVSGTMTPASVDNVEEYLQGDGAERHRRQRNKPPSTHRATTRHALLAAFQKHGTSLEQVVRLRIRAEALRDAAIRDLEWYRASILRSAAPTIEDAEFTEVAADGIKPETRSQPTQRTNEHRAPQSRRTRPRKSQRA